MPYAFTQRHKIMVVGVTPTEVVVASSLKLSGAQKVASGLTTINEVLRVAPENL